MYTVFVTNFVDSQSLLEQKWGIFECYTQFQRSDMLETTA